MFLRDILHVYTGGHFVVVLVNNKTYTFNSTVNFEIVSKIFEMFGNIIKSNFIAKYLKENAYRTTMESESLSPATLKRIGWLHYRVHKRLR